MRVILSIIVSAMLSAHTDAAALSQLMWHESADIPSDTEKVAVAWCVFNRVDDPRFPDSVITVLEQPGQFDGGYDPEYPVEPALYSLALEAVIQWRAEKTGVCISRPIPEGFVFYSGDGRHNYFRKEE